MFVHESEECIKSNTLNILSTLRHDAKEYATTRKKNFSVGLFQRFSNRKTGYLLKMSILLSYSF